MTTGRPRGVYGDTYKIVSDLDAESWKRLRAKCCEQQISVRKLVRSLTKGWLEEPVLRIVYSDPTIHANSTGPDYPVVLKECIGWPVSEDGEKISLRWERTLNADKLPNLQDAAGPSPVFSIPRQSIVELRRTTA